MATADEIFEQLAEAVPEHDHRVIDSDTYFIINPITRQISNVTSSKNVLMQFDHDSERFTFELPRFVEGHDMMLCNSVKVHYNNISSEFGDENIGTYDVDDLRIDPNNSDVVICTWLISRNATMYAGPLSFIVQYACVDNDGNVVYEWYSDIYSDIEIKTGRNNGEASVIEYTDILEQWRAKLFGVEDSVTANIVSASETQQTEIAAKGAETLATIPEDYTEVANMADEALRRKSDAIIVSESGEYVYLDDSSDCNLVGLNVYGKTPQLQTTGKNLLNCPEDLQFVQVVGYDVSIPAGTYIMSFEDNIVSGPNGLCVRFYDNDVWIILDNNKKSGTVVFEKPETHVYMYSNGTTNNDGAGITAKVKRLMISLDGGTYEPYSNGLPTPTPTFPQELVPIIDPKLQIRGLNLVTIKNRTFTYGGLTFTRNDDGSIHITGTSNGGVSYLFDNTNPIYLTNVDLIASLGHTNNDIGMVIGYYRSDGTFKDTLDKVSTTEHVFRFPDDAVSTRIYLHVYNAGTYDVIVRPKIRLARSEASTEPLKAIQYLTMNYTLRGIPVDSGGNYTDENGQQWICDEIDFERGKYIQRVMSLTLDGTQTFGINNYQLQYVGGYAFETYVPAITGQSVEIPVMSSHLPRRLWGVYAIDKDGVYATAGRILINFGDQTIKTVEELQAYLQVNPIDVIYERDTPVETDLTSAEMEVFRALHTNATNTTIANSENASVAVKYVADVKRYIYKNCNVKRKFDLTLLESNWIGHENDTYFTQVVDLDVGEDVKIDLHPTAAQLIDLLQDGVSMFVANENGVVTVYSVGGYPGTITIRATETVVYYE